MSVADALGAPPGHAVLWLLDFDAALRDPASSSTRIPPHRRALLALLANRPATVLAIAGGRGVSELAGAVGLGEPVVYLGYFGLEIKGQGLDSVHPDAHRSSRMFARMARRLRRLTDALPGVRVECHRLGLTLHVGEASEEDADRAEDALNRVAERYVSEHRVRCFRGAEAFELLPVVGAGEVEIHRRLIAELAERQGVPIWTICIGDHIRSGGWFEAVGDAGISVAVGSRPSRATYRVDRADDVDDLLRQALAGAEAAESLW